MRADATGYLGTFIATAEGWRMQVFGLEGLGEGGLDSTEAHTIRLPAGRRGARRRGPGRYRQVRAVGSARADRL